MEEDIHGPHYNGVSEWDIDEAMKISIGPILDTIPANYEKYGPPPIESYLTAAQYAFRIGYTYGYRRAHVDLIHD